MKRTLYKSTDPISNEEVLKGLARINQKEAGHFAEIEGLTAQLKEAKGAAEKRSEEKRKVLTAINMKKPVYLLNTGELTIEGPDKQLEFGKMSFDSRDDARKKCPDGWKVKKLKDGSWGFEKKAAEPADKKAPKKKAPAKK